MRVRSEGRPLPLTTKRTVWWIREGCRMLMEAVCVLLGTIGWLHSAGATDSAKAPVH